MRLARLAANSVALRLRCLSDGPEELYLSEGTRIDNFFLIKKVLKTSELSVVKCLKLVNLIFCREARRQGSP